MVPMEHGHACLANSVAWCHILEQLGLRPRALADDLMISDGGDQELKTFEEGVDTTIDMMGNMGATVATQKCVIMANNRKERSHLRRKRWGRGQMDIPVELHWRDLGAHLSMHGAPRAGTLNERTKRPP